MMPALNTISLISSDPTRPEVASWHLSPEHAGIIRAHPTPPHFAIYPSVLPMIRITIAIIDFRLLGH